MKASPIGLILNTGPSTMLGLDNNPHSPLPKNMSDPPPQGNNYYPVLVTQGYWVQAGMHAHNNKTNNVTIRQFLRHPGARLGSS